MDRDRARDRSIRGFLGRRGLLATLVALVALGTTGCQAATPSFEMPPDASPPEVVLKAYLDAYKANDCTSARLLWASAARVTGDGDLCGEAPLALYRMEHDPATPLDGVEVFMTTLTTDGSRDGSVRAGSIFWFYTLARRPDGTWRITGGGSGP